MSDLTDTRLSEILRDAEAATQGEWETFKVGDGEGWAVYLGETGDTTVLDKPNARHISNLDPPTAVALVWEVMRLRADKLCSDRPKEDQ